MPRVARRSVWIFLPVLVALTVASRPTAQVDGLRTIQFETTQVTAPDVAVSPDGEWLIFTMLGKLFRLPAKGGEAEQLTFGPYYDNDPVISPDGKLVAFQSDRDGSEGNIFVLRLENKEITQLTHESWVDSPTWAPDGRSLVYLRLERAAWNPADSLPRPPRPPAVVRRVRLAGGDPETLRALGGEIRSPFHLPDGRMGWAIVERDAASRRVTTRIEVRDGDGRVSTLRVLDGAADPVVASPRADGLYISTADGSYPRYGQPFAVSQQQPEVWFAPLPEGTERRIAPVPEETGFAVAADNATLYLGNLGHLWKVTLPGGRREAIAFRARVTLAIREPVPPPTWTPVAPGNSAPVRTIEQPRLSPDGSRVVFRALARLWQQPLHGGQAQRLVVDSAGTERDPAFSPDGRQLAFVRDRGVFSGFHAGTATVYGGRGGDQQVRAQGQQEIQVLDLRSGQTRTVGSQAECGYEYLTWSLHGELIAALSGSCNHRVVAIEPTAGTVRVLAETSNWEPWPQLSADGQTLYFQARFPGSDSWFYRLQLDVPGKPEPLFRLPAGAEVGINIATHEQWVGVALPAQNRNVIRLATLRGAGIAPADVRVISTGDESEFSFTPDGSALLYVTSNTLWRQPLGGGLRQEIPIRLELRAPSPPPVLLQRVRVLDFAAGGFGTETSLLIDGGRIRWIGPAQGRELPRGTVTVDAGGRLAIPGLFEMHGHGGGCGGEARIAYGVTSVRNMGGRLAGQNAHADRSDFTNDPVPRCFYAGRIFEGPPGRGEGGTFVHLFDEEDARTHVRLWKAQGAQFIKVYNRLPWPLQRTAADEARRVGLPVAAHGYTLEQVVKGVTLGYGGLTHWGTFYWFYDDALQMFAAAGTRWSPTLGVRGGVEVFFRDEPERFRRAPVGGLRLVGDNALRGYWAGHLRNMRAAYRGGITFLPGTDGSGPPGLALQWELEFYAEAGIPPLDILRFATQASAQTVGAGHDLGTLEVGKLADLILLDANPLEDIRNTQTIWRVVKGGWVFDPKMLLPNRD